MNIYLEDPEFAYFLGLIVGRGEIIQFKDYMIIKIEFPFRKSELEGYPQKYGIIGGIYEKVQRRLEKLLDTPVEIDTMEGSVLLKVKLGIHSFLSRLIKNVLGGGKTFREFSIPKIIFETKRTDVVKEFVRGIADVSGNIRKSNRDIQGFHRVYVDILNANWELPVQLCMLLQEKLKIPVSEILWGHPNLRGKKYWKREHQIRIYAHNFVEIGFRLPYKQNILDELVRENLGKLKEKSEKVRKRLLSGCFGGVGRRFSTKQRNKEENSPDLPDKIRGKHFDAYWQICCMMGCERARKSNPRCGQLLKAKGRKGKRK